VVSFKEVAVERAIGLAVPDYHLDGGAPPEALVWEEGFAGGMLEIWVVQPACADTFVRQAMNVLEQQHLRA
jgi:hypothetical protein